jgi:hypothetical protein
MWLTDWDIFAQAIIVLAFIRVFSHRNRRESDKRQGFRRLCNGNSMQEMLWDREVPGL